jgi:hypothetical protein
MARRIILVFQEFVIQRLLAAQVAFSVVQSSAAPYQTDTIAKTKG